MPGNCGTSGLSRTDDIPSRRTRSRDLDRSDTRTKKIYQLSERPIYDEMGGRVVMHSGVHVSIYPEASEPSLTHI